MIGFVSQVLYFLIFCSDSPFFICVINVVMVVTMLTYRVVRAYLFFVIISEFSYMHLPDSKNDFLLYFYYNLYWIWGAYQHLNGLSLRCSCIYISSFTFLFGY